MLIEIQNYFTIRLGSKFATIPTTN